MLLQLDWHSPRQKMHRQVQLFSSPCLQKKNLFWLPKTKGRLSDQNMYTIVISIYKCIQDRNLQLTRAMFVSGPSASTVTSPGDSETFSTKNSLALLSILLVLGSGRNRFPNPSLPWTKSATRGLPPYSRKYNIINTRKTEQNQSKQRQKRMQSIHLNKSQCD